VTRRHVCIGAGYGRTAGLETILMLDVGTQQTTDSGESRNVPGSINELRREKF